jgi:hypothetical protein
MPLQISALTLPVRTDTFRNKGHQSERDDHPEFTSVEG